jgi:hypothetical protein
LLENCVFYILRMYEFLHRVGQTRSLEGEVERLEKRATRAEQWLGTIKKEIEDTLIAPMEASRSKQQVLN